MTADEMLAGRQWALVEGDNAPTLAALADGSVDHVITDPPFEKEAHTMGRRLKGKTLGDGDREVLEAPLSFSAITATERVAIALEIARLTRRWAVVFSQVEAVMRWQDALTLDIGFAARRIGVWVKSDAML